MAEEAAARLEGIAAGLQAEGIEVVTHAWPGEAVDALPSVASAYDADLIVVGSKGTAGHRRGSSAACPTASPIGPRPPC